MPGAHEGLLDQVLAEQRIAGQAEGVGAQRADAGEELGFEDVARPSHFPIFAHPITALSDRIHEAWCGRRAAARAPAAVSQLTNTPSSFKISPVARGVVMLAPVAFDRVTAKPSSASEKVSPRTGTQIHFTLSPPPKKT